MARPTHKPTDGMREQVGLWAAAGINQERIASFIPVHVDTFRKHYKDDYESGKDKMTAKLFEVSYQVAIDKNHRDGSKERQFLLKTRSGYTEKTAIDVKHTHETVLELIESQEGSTLSADNS